MDAKDTRGLSDEQYNQYNHLVQRIQRSMHYTPLSDATSNDTQAFWPNNSTANSVQFTGTFH